MATIAPQGRSLTAILVTFLLALAGVVSLVPVAVVSLAMALVVAAREPLPRMDEAPEEGEGEVL